MIDEIRRVIRERGLAGLTCDIAGLVGLIVIIAVAMVMMAAAI